MTNNKVRVVFMGTPDFAVESLDAIMQAGHEVVGVVTVPDRQTGRGLKVTFSPVKEYALAHGLKILQPEKLKDEAFLNELRSLNADLFCVVAFRMLPREVWTMPRLGTFNLHGSLLPRYRGAAPLNWAIINGETETGITSFLLNERIDEGAILLSQSTPIAPTDTVEHIHDRLAVMGRDLVVRTIEGLVQGTITPQPQHIEGEYKAPNGANALLAPKIFKADCAIDWNKGGIDIVNFVRGLSPYPAATMAMTDDKGKSQACKVFEVDYEYSENSERMSILTDKKTFFKIGIANGYIHILSLQMSGKKRISVAEFLRGYNVNNWKIES